MPNFPIRSLADGVEVLERILTGNILPFWYPRTIDTDGGGFRLNHDYLGRWRGPANKFVVTQARQTWLFSRLFRERYGDHYLEAARHGFAFLKEHLWDRECGGFFWSVDGAGNPAPATRIARTAGTSEYKHLYGQAFALFAVSEYALASDDRCAVALAIALFGLMEDHAHDAEHSGYREFLRRNWSQAPATKTSFLSGASPDHKLFNTHLHLLEALTSFYVLTGDERAGDRLSELIHLLSHATVRLPTGACTNVHERDWRPVLAREGDMVSYGHDVESIHLLIAAQRAIGLSSEPDPLLDLYRKLFGNALRHGYDHAKGGFYMAGRLNAPARRREKINWVQAECLLGGLEMYRITGEAQYRDCFLGTLNWIAARQVDWAKGEWHVRLAPNGRPSGDKAGPWSGGYHNGRAVIQCLRLLPALAQPEMPVDDDSAIASAGASQAPFGQFVGEAC